MRETYHGYVFEFAMILQKHLKVTGYIFENYIFLFQFSNWMHFLNISRTLFNCIFITLYYLKLITGLWHYYSYFLHFIVSSCHPFSPFSFLSNLFFYSIRWIYRNRKIYLYLIQELKCNCKTVTYDKIFNI